jgi:hypothetical protein
MPTKKVTLTHPKLGDRTITVSEQAAKVHAEAGWKPATKAQAADAPKA